MSVSPSLATHARVCQQASWQCKETLLRTEAYWPHSMSNPRHTPRQCKETLLRTESYWPHSVSNDNDVRLTVSGHSRGAIHARVCQQASWQCKETLLRTEAYWPHSMSNPRHTPRQCKETLLRTESYCPHSVSNDNDVRLTVSCHSRGAIHARVCQQPQTAASDRTSLPPLPPPPTAPAIVTVATVVTALPTAITPALVQQEDTAALAQQEAPASAPEPTSAHGKWDLPVPGAQEFQLIQA
jgi:hypothetical protein